MPQHKNYAAQSNKTAQKNFSLTPRISSGIQRSVFNRSHGHKTGFNADQLVPFYVDEILPGDDLTLSAQIYARVPAPLVNPIMDNLHIDTFFFYVPNRIIWDNWEKFQGAQDDPADSIVFTIPKFDETIYAGAVNDLQDYMGIPPRTSLPVGTHITSLYARAYNLIWNEWFRDENLQDSLVVDKDDGPDDDSDYTVKRRNKSHDYFTSCLPFTQKGTAPTVNLGGNAPVVGDGTTMGFTDSPTSGGNAFGLYADVGAPSTFKAESTLLNVAVGTSWTAGTIPTNDVGLGVSQIAAESGLVADLSNATGFTINDLRDTLTIQHLLEMDARGGTRYTEILKSHWGVTAPDFRLQRPEYLGGGSQGLSINPVAQTTPSPTTPVADDSAANQSGYVTGASKSGFSKSFVEHGVIIGMVNVRADLTYQQGLHKKFQRETRVEHYMPVFANLGEQAVRNSEIWWQSATLAIDEATFGFQEAWADYRYFPSIVTGKLRSDAPDNLANWHLSQDFATLPVLNGSFLEPDASNILDRVKTYVNGPDIIFDSWITLKHAREMPVYSIPGIRRF